MGPAVPCSPGPRHGSEEEAGPAGWRMRGILPSDPGHLTCRQAKLCMCEAILGGPAWMGQNHEADPQIRQK